MLKCDFHSHAGIDDNHKLDHSPRELIDRAAKLGYDVFAITSHNKLTYSKGLANYAKKKGILLIPGAELVIEGKEVIVLNVTKKLMGKINTFADLRRHKNKNLLVMAPHPYYPDSKALHSKLIENINLFDAIEYSHFYLPWINIFNEKAQKTAKRYKLPMLGTSDCHTFEQLGITYTLVDAKPTIKSVFEAIRKKKVKVATRPIPTLRAMKIITKIYLFY